jgi:hypothetical protein
MSKWSSTLALQRYRPGESKRKIHLDDILTGGQLWSKEVLLDSGLNQVHRGRRTGASNGPHSHLMGYGVQLETTYETEFENNPSTSTVRT